MLPRAPLPMTVLVFSALVCAMDGGSVAISAKKLTLTVCGADYLPFHRREGSLASSVRLRTIPLRHQIFNGVCVAPASATPCLPLSNNVGYIQITLAGGTSAGYVKSTLNSKFYYTRTPSLSLALVVVLPLSPFDGPFDMPSLTIDDPGHDLFCAAGADDLLGTGRSGHVYITGVLHSDANPPPSSIGGKSTIGDPSESQIWSMDCHTYELTAQWTNTGLAQPSTRIFYDALGDSLGLTGDLSTVGSTVTFTFVPRTI
ncbi:hypothetical protein DFH06DRAFT_1334251 [Mycena polygramma]|nr:hypothetical protein DFH06DRAFT_1334251 [Mycena polygramma]